MVMSGSALLPLRLTSADTGAPALLQPRGARTSSQEGTAMSAAIGCGTTGVLRRFESYGWCTPAAR